MMRETQVPSRTVYTITNRTPHRGIVENAMELIDPISIGPATPVGTSWTINLNPLNLDETRIKQLSSSYQQYRFRKAKLMFGNTVSTAVNGSIAMAYLANPDQELPDNPVRAIFGAGGKTGPVWQPMEVEARLMDKGPVNGYYNLDADSGEIMMTTQGKFVIALQSRISTTDIIDFPLYLEYEIEFIGAAIQQLAVPPAGWPQILGAGVVSKSATAGAFAWTVNTGENLPTFTLNSLYELDFPVQLETVSGQPENATIFKPMFSGSLYYGGRWYENIEAANADSAIVPPTAAWQKTVPRNVISPLN